VRPARIALVTTLLAALAAAPAHAALDPAVEAANYGKTLERQAIYDSPSGQARLREVSLRNGMAALAAQAADPEREFATDLCWNGHDGCAGDARLYEWQDGGHGIVEPVLFTARNGATLSGHVWATRSGPAQRPGVVITNGSVQADEQMYWYAAQALAKAGYVVLTFDPQGQGQSDTAGEGADAGEGVPAQTDGRPFFDGTTDALNFFFSTPRDPYVPETSCSGTSHAAKQERRAAAGLDAAYNPFWSLFDRRRVGLAGHSYGAAGVSYIGQLDPRVDAIVAWDNLSQPSPGRADGSFPPGAQDCPAHPEERVDLTPALASGERRGKPALGLSADYFLPPTPNVTEPPSPEHCDAVADAYAHGTPPSREDGIACKSLASKLYSRLGVDTGEIVIRGGSHLEFSFISNPAFGATLRGADLTTWYTTAWFDKYVKGDPSADRRLLSDRWRHDTAGAAVDPGGDGNLFSFYHPSRLDIHRAGGRRVTCEDLRDTCRALRPRDGRPGEYSYLALATSPDGEGGPRTPRGSGIYGTPPPVETPGLPPAPSLGGVLGR